MAGEICGVVVQKSGGRYSVGVVPVQEDRRRIAHSNLGDLAAVVSADGLGDPVPIGEGFHVPEGLPVTRCSISVRGLDI